MRCARSSSAGHSTAETCTYSHEAGHSHEAGYSLSEIMIVVIIIGILALLALPRFLSVTTRAKQTEAKTMLAHLHTLEQAHLYEYDRYSLSLDTLGFEPAPLVTSGGTARYAVGVEEATRGAYVATATSIVDFDGDGVFNVWQIDESGRVTERVPD